MNLVVFMFALELGYRPMGDMLMGTPPEHVDFEIMYSTLDFEAEIADAFFIGTEVTSTLMPMAVRDFQVDNIGYMVKIGFRPTDWLEFGWRHWCQHPVFPWLTWGQDDLSPQWEMWYEEAYARVQLRVSP